MKYLKWTRNFKINFGDGLQGQGFIKENMLLAFKSGLYEQPLK